jgi:hypothetical protein
MTADLEPRDELTERLRALGRRPVDPSLQSEHLTAMAGVRTGSAFRTSLAGRLKIGAGVLAGFLLGATGLTTAGALGPLQPIAADGVEAATPLKHLPDSASTKAKEKAEKAAKDGAGSASRLEDGSIGTQRIWTADCEKGEDGTYAGNRGQYLKQERAKGAEALQKAKDSDCGKPVADDETDDDAKTDDTGSTADETKGQSQDDHGKSDDAGASADKGKSGDKGKAADAGKPADAGKSDDAANPATVPSLPDQADDNAEPPSTHTPGDPTAPADGAPQDDA